MKARFLPRAALAVATALAGAALPALLDQVVAALVRDPGMQGADIEVRVDSGKVTLDGKAKDSAQADHARQLAGNIAGSGKVTSNLSTPG
ncbi:MAG TPA: BON domain-containing protein [Usitatibacter sp.]|nr:BON domain-containing protein [Usitatibacter sp.]